MINEIISRRSMPVETVIDRRLLNKPKEKYWLSYINQRIGRNKNFLGFISGPTGAGKSYTCLSICEQIDPEFSVERCVFSGLELMKLINSKKLKKGSAIMFDEMSIDMDNRNWNSTTNKMINYLMQTFRYRGFIMLMNSPFMDFVDSKTRKLFHAEMSIKRIDFDTSECVLAPRLIQYNTRQQKFYYKRLRVINPHFGNVPIDTWRVVKPSELLRKAYEQKKDFYARLLNKRIESELSAIDNPEEKVDKRTKVVDMEKFRFAVEEGLSISALCAKFNIGFEKCSILKAKLREDGKAVVFRPDGVVGEPVFGEFKMPGKT